MIHVLIKKSDTQKQPMLNHFQSATEANGYYRDGIPGVVIANESDLKKALSEHKNDDMVIAMLNSIDPDTLDGTNCSIKDGVCVVAPPKAKAAI